jgi:short-subunit dehydrogenase
MDNVKKQLASYGDNAHYELIDLCDYRKAEAYVKAIGDEKGRIDYVFANAGGGTVNRIDEITWEMWEDVIGSNLYGTIAAVKGAVPFMKKQHEGHIVITASLAGYSVNPYQAPYVATKHAVYGMAQSLNYELRADNIFVQAVCPGFVRTPIFTRNGEPEEAIPPQCIPVEQAVDEIFAGIEKGDVTINVCDEARAYYKALRDDPEYCDSEMRNLAEFYSHQL